MVEQVIRQGDLQNPPMIFEVTVKAGEIHTEYYSFDYFRVLEFSGAVNELEIKLGSSGGFTRYFDAGLGTKLNFAVDRVQIRNIGAVDFTIRFAVAIGSITDDRLSLTGAISTVPLTPNTVVNNIDTVLDSAWTTHAGSSTRQELIVDCADCTNEVGIILGALAGGEVFADSHMKVFAGDKIVLNWQGEYNIISSLGSQTVRNTELRYV